MASSSTSGTKYTVYSTPSGYVRAPVGLTDTQAQNAASLVGRGYTEKKEEKLIQLQQPFQKDSNHKQPHKLPNQHLLYQLEAYLCNR